MKCPACWCTRVNACRCNCWIDRIARCLLFAPVVCGHCYHRFHVPAWRKMIPQQESPRVPTWRTAPPASTVQRKAA